MSRSEAAVDPNRFDKSGHWMTPPEYFVEDAEDRVIAGMLSEKIRSSLDNLPEVQRQVEHYEMLRDLIARKYASSWRSLKSTRGFSCIGVEVDSVRTLNPASEGSRDVPAS
jgi:hypothetical protein